MVKRYSCQDPEESQYGDYVSLADYAALEAECERLKQEKADMAIELMNWRAGSKLEQSTGGS